MCSNNSYGSSGGDNSGGDSLYSKKLKRQRVPKRGPGVAELEKILREQEKRSDFSLMSPVSPPFSGGDGRRKVGATGVFSPEQDLLPKMWNSLSDGNGDGKFGCKIQFSNLPFNGSANQLFPSSSNLMQNSTIQNSPPSTKNLFPNCNGREPPSIQTTYRHSSPWPEEDKMVGEKRGRTVDFPVEIPPVPTFRYHIPAMMSAQINRFDSSFSCDATLFNFEPVDQSISSKRSHIDHGESSDVGNLLMFPSQIAPPSLIHAPNIFYPFHLPEIVGNSNEPTNAQGGSIRKKPFYSFLPAREKSGIAESLNTERVETKGDAIDLELRL